MVLRSFRVLYCAILTSLLLASCSFTRELLQEGREYETINRQETYTINPATLIKSIMENRNDVFILLEETPIANPSQKEYTVKWSQSDYLFVAHSFHKFVTNEELENWQLGRIAFGLLCKDITYGPQFIQFLFFRYMNKTKRADID